jgi:hypothetical protein
MEPTATAEDRGGGTQLNAGDAVLFDRMLVKPREIPFDEYRTMLVGSVPDDTQPNQPEFVVLEPGMLLRGVCRRHRSALQMILRD